MSADLDTNITIRGNKDELFSMLKLLRSFEVDNYERYNNGEDCAYLESVEVGDEDNGCELAYASDEELLELILEVGNELDVHAVGPWGEFIDPSGIGLFERLSDIAPNASFNGTIEGFVDDADISHTAELNNGILSLSCNICNDDEEEIIKNRFYNPITKKYSKTNKR